MDRGKIPIDDGVETVDLAAGNPRQIIELRRRTVGYVSQFPGRAARFHARRR